MWSLYEIIHIWTAVVDESEECSSQYIFQFKQLERRSLRKNQGFNGIRTRDLRDTGAMLYQLSYEATHWERGQLLDSEGKKGVSITKCGFFISKIHGFLGASPDGIVTDEEESTPGVVEFKYI